MPQTIWLDLAMRRDTTCTWISSRNIQALYLFTKATILTRKLISTTCICSLILSVTTQSSSLKVRVGLEINRKLRALHYRPIFTAMAQCDIGPDCIIAHAINIFCPTSCSIRFSFVTCQYYSKIIKHT